MVKESKYVVIGVKPHVVLPVLQEVYESIISSFHVIVSVANGITTSTFEEVPYCALRTYLVGGKHAAMTPSGVSCCIMNGLQKLTWVTMISVNWPFRLVISR